MSSIASRESLPSYTGGLSIGHSPMTQTQASGLVLMLDSKLHFADAKWLAKCKSKCISILQQQQSSRITSAVCYIGCINRKRFRGQIFGIDVMLALLIFYVIFASISVAQREVELRGDEFDQLSLSARVASSYLINSPGSPSGWNTTTVQVIGISSDRAIISTEKLSLFLNLSQVDLNKTLELLGISGDSFYFYLSDIDGNLIQINSSNFNGTAQIGSDFSLPFSAAARSIVVYNSSRAIMYLKVGKS